MTRTDILFSGAIIAFGAAMMLDMAMGFEPARAHEFGMAAFILMIAGTVLAFIGFKRAS